MSTLVFRRGDRGPAVAEIRARLARLGLMPGSKHVRAEDAAVKDLVAPNLDRSLPEPAAWETTALISAEYDEDLEQAVRAFQRERGITVDGIVGAETFKRLEEARWRLGDRVLSYLPSRTFAGDDVLDLQRRLNRMGFDCGLEDSHFGPLTDRALREFQANIGSDADGVCGPATLRALGQLNRTVGGSSAHEARERYNLPNLRTGVAGKTVVLDPGHGLSDPGDGSTGPATGSSEAHVVAALADLIDGRLAALGTRVVITRPTAGLALGSPPDEEARAKFCNDVRADLVVSLHTRHLSTESTQGLSVYYYGRSAEVLSISGRAAAQHMCEHIAASLADVPCQAHPRGWDLLRMTRMPAVRIDVGSLYEASEAGRLADRDYLTALAAAIAGAIAEFFAPLPAEGEAIPDGSH